MKSLLVALFVVALTVAATMTPAYADPLSGEVLKFSQLPLNNGLPPTAGGAPYPGHDEWSTAYLTPQPTAYQGSFMADDFSDTANTSVYHVSWWGSYDQNQTFNGVQKFLISFESDLPFDPNLGASRPDQVLSSEVVSLGALAPGSGTFTEKLVNGNVPEHLYQYNAELKLPFAEQANQIYWLKIVALVDPATEGNINWGWHDRDWSLKNTLASPVPTPGENVIGTVVDPNGLPQPVWHFQDDAVSGRILMTPNTAGNGYNIQQAGYQPQNYVFIPGAVPIDGPFGIQNFSKDLAFQLYTRVPEPSTYLMAAMGSMGLALAAWKHRRAKRSP
ncbi:MAG: PEP-CTERM sorting domain-containing protein [Singulisphaera sp.]